MPDLVTGRDLIDESILAWMDAPIAFNFLKRSASDGELL